MPRTTPIIYQPFTIDLLEPVWQLRLRALKEHPSAFGEPYASAILATPEEVRARGESWTEQGNPLFLALSDQDTPVGMLGIRRETRERERHRTFVWGVYVAPEVRGLGIASHLLQMAIAHARSEVGIRQVHLIVNSTNTAAKESYERAGFQQWGTMPRAEILDGVGIDHDHMVLLLDAD